MSAAARLGLRIAATQILRDDPLIAAATGGQVLDSFSGEPDALSGKPMIFVHTESMEGQAWSANNGGPPFAAQCELVFEITHVASARNGNETVIFRPVTTAELEAALDVLEWRIPDVLAFGDSALARGLRQYALRRITAVQSERFEDDEGVRRASRLLTLACELVEEWYGARHPDDAAPTGPFATLPEPLRNLAPLLPAGSTGATVLTQVAAAIPAATPGPAFAGADMTLRPGPQPQPEPTDGAEFGGRAVIP